jgi:phosphatidylglycerophosphate synthase
MAVTWANRSSWLEIWGKFETFGKSCETKFKQVRRPITSPFCSLLMRWHINQSHVSLFRFFPLPCFALLWINQKYPGALIVLAVYFFLDWIDGDLAKALNNQSDLGKFEDLTIDNLMVVTFPFVLIWQNLVPGWLGALYIFLVTQSWWFSVLRRNADWKSDWLFRPSASALLHILRFWIVTIFMILYAIWRVDWFTPTLGVLSVMLVFNVVYDHYQIIKNRLHNRA